MLIRILFSYLYGAGAVATSLQNLPLTRNPLLAHNIMICEKQVDQFLYNDVKDHSGVADDPRTLRYTIADARKTRYFFPSDVWREKKIFRRIRLSDLQRKTEHE